MFSTHATPTGIMSLYKEKYNPHIWLGVVVTDFTVHRWLVCNGVDAYFLADKKLADLVLPGSSLKNNEAETKAGPSFQDKKASGDLHLGAVPQVFAYGIPVRRIFSEHNFFGAQGYRCPAQRSAKGIRMGRRGFCLPACGRRRRYDAHGKNSECSCTYHL